MTAKLNLVAGKALSSSSSPRTHIPMSEPDITSEDIAAVVEVLNSKCLSLGPRLQKFEEAFAAYTGTRYAVGVSNGTAGLHALFEERKLGRAMKLLPRLSASSHRLIAYYMSEPNRFSSISTKHL